MRVKLLRSFGKNLVELFPPKDDDGDFKGVFDKDTPWLEGQVRECPDKAAHYLVRNGLAEETEEEITKVAKTPAPKAAAVPGSHKVTEDKK